MQRGSSTTSPAGGRCKCRSAILSASQAAFGAGLANDYPRQQKISRQAKASLRLPVRGAFARIASRESLLGRTVSAAGPCGRDVKTRQAAKSESLRGIFRAVFARVRVGRIVMDCYARPGRARNDREMAVNTGDPERACARQAGSAPAARCRRATKSPSDA